MFHDIPRPILARMQHLEAIDARDRVDGTPRARRMRQVPPETGRLVALLAATAPDGDWVEIGASAGYSTLWLALAARATGRHITTFEVLPDKARLARETFRLAEVEPLVTLVEGDARDHLASLGGAAYCFLDAEKEIYGECYDLVVPNLVPGGLLVADNALNHWDSLEGMIRRAEQDPRVDALVVSHGKGLLLCRRV